MPRSRPRTSRLLGAQGARERDPREEAGSSAVDAPTPARSFSGRFLALVLVTVLIVFLAAPTTKIYLEQRAEIAELERSIAAMEAEQASLEAQVDQWSDETYIKQQARERLLYVMPGERSYLVVGAEEMQDAVVDSSAARAEAAKPAWVDALWQSVVAAAYVDAPGAGERRDEEAAPETTGDPSPGTGSSGGAAPGAARSGSADTGAPADAGTPVETGTPAESGDPAGAAVPGAGDAADPAGTGADAGATGGTDLPPDAATRNRGPAAEEGMP